MVTLLGSPKPHHIHMNENCDTAATSCRFGKHNAHVYSRRHSRVPPPAVAAARAPPMALECRSVVSRCQPHRRVCHDWGCSCRQLKRKNRSQLVFSRKPRVTSSNFRPRVEPCRARPGRPRMRVDDKFGRRTFSACRFCFMSIIRVYGTVNMSSGMVRPTLRWQTQCRRSWIADFPLRC